MSRWGKETTAIGLMPPGTEQVIHGVYPGTLCGQPFGARGDLWYDRAVRPRTINRSIASMEEDLARPRVARAARELEALRARLTAEGATLAAHDGRLHEPGPGTERRKLWENAWTLAHSGARAGDLVLEAGGASTLLGFALAAAGCRVAQVDIGSGGLAPIAAANAAARARGWPLVSLLHDMRRPLPFSGGVFDACFCISVLEHLQPRSRRLLCAQLGASLRPGGVLALTFDWIRDRGPYPRGLRFRERERLLAEVIGPSGCEVMGNRDWVDDDSDEVFCGALFLRKPGAAAAGADRAKRLAAFEKLKALAELSPRLSRFEA